jgi:DNA-binding transcriptional LysR family regulator
VTEFLSAYPDVSVRLSLSDHVTHLLDDHIDLGVRIGALPDSSLIAMRVGTMRHVVCASPDYLKAHGTPRVPSDLASHDCIDFERLTLAPHRWSFHKDGQWLEVPVRTRLRVNTAEAAVDAAVTGTGIVRVFLYQAESALRGGTLKRLLKHYEPEPAPVHLVYPGQGQLPLKLRAFLDFAAPRLRSRLSTIG